MNWPLAVVCISIVWAFVLYSLLKNGKYKGGGGMIYDGSKVDDYTCERQV